MMPIRALRMRTPAVSTSALAGALVYRTTQTSVAANTDIPFESESYDTNNYFTVGTSAANLVAATTGLHRVQINCSISGNINNESTKSYKNGSGLLGGSSCCFQNTAGFGFGNGASGVLSLTAGDTVKNQNSFATVNYCAGSDPAYTWEAIELLDPATKYALVYPSASLSITSGAWRTLAYDSEVADTDNIHSTVTNNGRLTVPSGVTRVRLSWGIVTSNTTTNIAGCCAKNGTTNFSGAPTDSRGGGGNKLFSALGPPVAVTAGDYFEHQVFASVSCSILNDPYTWFCLENVPASIKSCIAKRTSSQTLTTSYTDVLFNANEYDDASIHSTSSNTERFVVPAGCTRARFHYGSNSATSLSGTVAARSKVNGSYVAGGTACGSDTGYGWVGFSTPWLSVVPGDYFSLEAKVTSGTMDVGSGTWAALECE